MYKFFSKTVALLLSVVTLGALLFAGGLRQEAYAAHSHEYVGGICTGCGDEYPLSPVAFKVTVAVTAANGAKVWSRPYSDNSVHKYTADMDTVLAVENAAQNQSGNAWYQLDDGNWVYSGDVTQCFAVTFHANGGKNAPSGQYARKGAKVTLPTAEPTRVGYTFQGWATSSSETVAQYQAGGSFSTGKDVTLYAVWKTCSHDYTAGICRVCEYEHPLGVTADDFSVKVTNADGAKRYSRPYSSSDYISIAAKGEVLSVAGTATNQEGEQWLKLRDGSWVCADHVVRAYRLKFHANGGSNGPAAIIKEKNTTVTIPAAKPVRTGYTFLGWSKAKSGSVQIKPGDAYVITADRTLYAAWAKNVAIAAEPDSQNVKAGTKVSLTVKATGTKLTYCWQYRKTDSGTWKNCVSASGKTAALTFSPGTQKDGYQYRCRITDGYGNTATSKTVTLRVLGITDQPETSYTQSGEVAKVAVKATGKDLTYQWYIKNTGDRKFGKSSVKKAAYSATMRSSAKDRQVYCVITDASGNQVTSETVYLRMAATVTKQPQTAYAGNGAAAKTTVQAAGDGLTYQWYIKNAGGSKFGKSSVTAATYSVTMSSKSKDRQLYCVVTDKYGNSVKTETVTLRRKVTVTGQPKSVTVASGKTAKTTVSAMGDGLTYRWYYKNPGEKDFRYTATFKGSAYSVVMNGARNGRKVYCVITDQYGYSVKTDTVTLKMR